LHSAISQKNDYLLACFENVTTVFHAYDKILHDQTSLGQNRLSMYFTYYLLFTIVTGLFEHVVIAAKTCYFNLNTKCHKETHTFPYYYYTLTYKSRIRIVI